MKVGFYHHGTRPAAEVAEAISATGLRVAPRNADYFDVRDVEAFDVVIVTEGKNETALREAYGERAVTVEEFIASLPVKGDEGQGEAAAFDPDAPVKKAKGKRQG